MQSHYPLYAFAFLLLLAIIGAYVYIILVERKAMPPDAGFVSLKATQSMRVGTGQPFRYLSYGVAAFPAVTAYPAQTHVALSTPAPSTPHVVVSLSQPVEKARMLSAYVTDVTAQGFTIVLDSPCSVDASPGSTSLCNNSSTDSVSVSWIVIA